MRDSHFIRELLPELVGGEHHQLFTFGYELATIDTFNGFLNDIRSTQHDLVGENSGFFFGGYLRGLRTRDEEMWEKVVLGLLADEQAQAIVTYILPRSGINKNIFQRILELYDEGQIVLSQLQFLRYGREIQQIPEALIEELLKRFAKVGSFEATSMAIELMYRVYCDKGKERILPKALALSVLLSPKFPGARPETMASYYWSGVTEQFVSQHPEHKWDMYKTVVAGAKKLGFAYAMHGYPKAAMDKIVQSDPAHAWSIISEMLNEDLESEAENGVRTWLRPEYAFGADGGTVPVSLFPVDLVLEWIAKKPSNRAPLIASLGPKSLDVTGNGYLNHEILARFGDIAEVSREIWHCFLNGGWSGSASEYHTANRDRALKWLVNEQSPYVRRWIETYVDSENESIRVAEIREERQF